MILIGTDDGIYRWFDGCGWPIFHSLQGRVIVSLASPGAGLIAAIDRDGTVLESVNNGMDWQVIPGPDATGTSTPATLAVWGEPETIVLATKPLALFRRIIGAPLPEPPGPAWASRARTLAEGATALLAPRRRTTTRPIPVWTGLGTPAAARGKGASGPLVRAFADGGGIPPSWFAAIRGAGLWRSLDEGTKWEQCPGLPDEVVAVRTVPTRPGTVIAATAEGCRISTDNGQTWEDRSTGLEKARHVAAIEVKPDNPDILLAGAAPRAPDAAGAAHVDGLQFALYESTNGGKTWTQVKRGFPEDIRHDVITDIRYDPVAPENVIVALGSGELWLSRFDRAYWTPLARQTKAARVLCATP